MFLILPHIPPQINGLLGHNYQGETKTGVANPNVIAGHFGTPYNLTDRRKCQMRQRYAFLVHF